MARSATDVCLVSGCFFFSLPRLLGRSSPTPTSGMLQEQKCFRIALTGSSIGNYKIPTWTSPLVVCVVVSMLVSDTSFLGHLCAIAIGYLRKSIRRGYFVLKLIHNL